MLPGFEDHTEPLSESEEKLVPFFVDGFKKHVGKENVISNRQIREALEQFRGVKINEVTVRKIITHIRENGLVEGLVAGGSGYWISTDPEELDEYYTSLLGRSNKIRHIADHMKHYSNKLKKSQWVTESHA